MAYVVLVAFMPYHHAPGSNQDVEKQKLRLTIHKAWDEILVITYFPNKKLISFRMTFAAVSYVLAYNHDVQLLHGDKVSYKFSKYLSVSFKKIIVVSFCITIGKFSFR